MQASLVDPHSGVRPYNHAMNRRLTALLLIATLALAACGNRGPLVLPKDAPPQNTPTQED
jgi:predicted small lipoprotein YifL